MNFRKIIIFGLLFCCVPNLVLAQEQSYDIDAIRIVAPKRMESRAMHRVVVDSTLLRYHRANSLGDLLIQNSPVNIKSYGRGDIQTASLRGTAPSHTTLYWNGMRVNSPMMGAVDFSLIPVSFVDNMAVTAGISSLRNGAGALGGTIEVDSKADWSRRWSVDLTQTVGSFSSYDSYLNVRGGGESFQSSTKLFYNYSKNDFEFINRDIIDPQNPGYYPTVRNENADYRNYGFMQEFFMRFKGNQTLSAIVWGLGSDRNLPQLTTYEGDASNNLTSRSDQSLRGVVNYKYYGDLLHLSARVGISVEDMRFDQQNRVAHGYQTTIDSRGLSRSFMTSLDMSFRSFTRHRIESSTSLNADQVDSQERVKDIGFAKNRIEISQLIALYSDWNDRLSSSITVRAGIVGKKAYVSPLVGLEYRLTKYLALKLRGGHNTHAPTISDLYYVPGGNPDLRSERGWSVETGLGYSARGLKVDLNFYGSWIKDWIVWLPSHQQYWTPQNIREVSASGIELSASKLWRLGADWKIELNGNLAVNRTINNGDSQQWGDESVGKQLVYVPLVSGGLFSKFSWRKASLVYQLYGESIKYTSTSNNQDAQSVIEPYMLHDLTLGYTLRWFTVQFQCRNILNTQYYTVLRRPLPRRSFMATLVFSI